MSPAKAATRTCTPTDATTSAAGTSTATTSTNSRTATTHTSTTHALGKDLGEYGESEQQPR
jgi:hypothetical protein